MEAPGQVSEPPCAARAGPPFSSESAVRVSLLFSGVPLCATVSPVGGDPEGRGSKWSALRGCVERAAKVNRFGGFAPPFAGWPATTVLAPVNSVIAPPFRRDQSRYFT